jgi:hypothetical protein
MIRKLDLHHFSSSEKQNIITFNIGGQILINRHATFTQVSNSTLNTIIVPPQQINFNNESDVFIDYDLKVCQNLINQLWNHFKFFWEGSNEDVTLCWMQDERLVNNIHYCMKKVTEKKHCKVFKKSLSSVRFAFKNTRTGPVTDDAKWFFCYICINTKVQKKTPGSWMSSSHITLSNKGMVLVVRDRYNLYNEAVTMIRESILRLPYSSSSDTWVNPLPV